MSTGTIAAALGLVAAPGIGATLSDAFEQMGADAVFAAGCLERSAGRAIEAPARWALPVPLRWRGPVVNVIAETDGRHVTAVNLARPAVAASSGADCRAALIALAGAGPVSAGWVGPDLVFERSAGRIAGSAARYRAIFHATRQQCRTMLTIGGEGVL